MIAEPVMKLSKLPCERYSNQGTVQFGPEMFASKCVSKYIKIKTYSKVTIQVRTCGSDS